MDIAKDLEQNQSAINVTLIVDGERFVVDKNKLIEKSDYFKAMFSGNYREHSQEEIEMQLITAPALRYILEYIRYDITPYLCMNIIEDILHATNYLRMDALYCIIIDELISFIKKETCFQIFQIAQRFNITSVEIKVKSFILYSFNDIKDHVKYISDLETLYSYLTHEQLNVKNEFDIFETGCNWLKDNNRENDIMVILSCIIYQNLSIQNIENIISNIIVKKNDKALSVLTGILQVLINNPTVKEKQEIEKMFKKINNDHVDIICELLLSKKFRLPAIYPCIVQNTKGIYDIMKFDAKNNSLIKHMSLPEASWWGHSIVVWRGFYIIVLYGKRRDEFLWNYEIKMYNCLNERWSLLPTYVTIPRRHATVFIHNDSIYTIGGFGQYRITLANVQSYNIQTNVWIDLPQFPEYNSCIVATFHNNKLFASAGYLYVLEDNYWQKLFKLPVTHSALVSYNNRLYYSEKWKNKISFWENFTEPYPQTSSTEVDTIKNSHYNVSGICNIGKVAYIFSEGLEFESTLCVESCDFDTEFNKSTDVLWVDTASRGKYHTSFTMASFEINDNSIREGGVKKWLTDDNV